MDWPISLDYVHSKDIGRSKNYKWLPTYTIGLKSCQVNLIGQNLNVVRKRRKSASGVSVKKFKNKNFNV